MPVRTAAATDNDPSPQSPHYHITINQIGISSYFPDSSSLTAPFKISYSSYLLLTPHFEKMFCT